MPTILMLHWMGASSSTRMRGGSPFTWEDPEMQITYPKLRGGKHERGGNIQTGRF